jgi:hypothetical protein
MRDTGRDRGRCGRGRRRRAGTDIAYGTRSSVLFDTVAVYLAFTQELCKMEKLGIRVTDDGFTRIDDQAKKVNAAVEWKNLDSYRDLLVARLTER